MIHCPDGSLDWAQNHALLPTTELIGERIRIYASFCDRNGVGRIGFIEVGADNPSEVLSVYEKPVLDIGQPGTFDDNGVVPLCVLDYGGKKLLYYVGFQKLVNTKYYLFTGLATSNNGGYSFERFSRVPILDRNNADLSFRCGGFVIAGKIIKMWYIGGSDWVNVGLEKRPVYNMKYIESNNPFKWVKEGTVCFGPENEDEHGFGRPYVIKEKSLYKMFYSIRTKSKGYRMGYAESRNGKTWIRKDEELGLAISGSGWDSGIICYPNILKVHGKTYMFYNGNYLNSITAKGKMCIGYASLL